MSYGPDLEGAFHRAAYFVDRILKGAKPAELPIEQPNAFQLALNQRTARELGLRLPQSLLLRADEVIERTDGATCCWRSAQASPAAPRRRARRREPRVCAASACQRRDSQLRSRATAPCACRCRPWRSCSITSSGSLADARTVSAMSAVGRGLSTGSATAMAVSVQLANTHRADMHGYFRAICAWHVAPARHGRQAPSDPAILSRPTRDPRRPSSPCRFAPSVAPGAHRPLRAQPPAPRPWRGSSRPRSRTRRPSR